MIFEPKEGFDWDRVTWGRPDSPRSALCSYCSAVIRDGEVPLMMWKPDGHACQFCDSCMKHWWGIES
jgi:hypothetical protein